MISPRTELNDSISVVAATAGLLWVVESSMLASIEVFFYLKLRKTNGISVLFLILFLRFQYWYIQEIQ